MHFLCLVIQSDPALARATNRGLESYGLKPYHVNSIKSAIGVIRQWRFDVVMLDADGFGERVPDMLTLLRETNVPIVVSSSAPEEEAQIRQLEHGATALMTKPASVRLTALRLRKLAEIRRQDLCEVSPEVRLGPLLIDTRRARASVRDAPLDLSTRQFEILLLLATRAGEFVHRQDIASTSRRSRQEGSRSIDMHISRLRSKLRDAGDCGLGIYTVYGLGYCLSYKDEDAESEPMPKWCA